MNGVRPCLLFLKRSFSGFVSRVAPLVEGPELFARLHLQEPGLVKVVLQP